MQIEHILVLIAANNHYLVLFLIATFNLVITIIMIFKGRGKSGFNCWGGQGTRALVLLVLNECI